ncbi:adenine phosphoribosyltransferase [Oscillochloris sp. ZM17-4]|uniref:adenine phosphoribosyltransferase n=1 Tax=Oscillochloris sp. ZM17-4 TaxID=2866714 RepID=UPI001C73C7EA|nr:adenine phosphoribosyltransferase [Oscillochloris sp. ZM17-4]MBX0326266.1 adenine phosphoribosyltransferase [Oscillochloris sp. ZM17-4]
MSSHELADLVRNVPDFPLPGIAFKDITTLIGNGPAFSQVISSLSDRYRDRGITAVAGVESRGFIFSAPIALQLGVGLVPIRKPGKLPADTYQIEYSLEYGTNKLEIHRDAFETGAKVLVVDDLLATGGTIAAASKLIEQAGGTVVEMAFVIELTFLNGREKLTPYSIYSLIQY